MAFDFVFYNELDKEKIMILLLNQFNNKNLIQNFKKGESKQTLLMYASECVDAKEINILLSYFNNNQKEKLQYIAENDQVFIDIFMYIIHDTIYIYYIELKKKKYGNRIVFDYVLNNRVKKHQQEIISLLLNQMNDKNYIKSIRMSDYKENETLLMLASKYLNFKEFNIFLSHFNNNQKEKQQYIVERTHV